MRPHDIFIGSAASWLPPKFEISQAVQEHRLSAAAADKLGLSAVTVTDRFAPPEMAVFAALAALARMREPCTIGLLLQASMYYQGLDFGPSASFIQREALGYGCPTIEVRQMSNGGMAALDLAAHHLLSDPTARTALLTAAERYSPPGFDRWMSDPGTVYADGAAALILSKDGGFARIAALCTVSDPILEGMHRGAESFGAAPFAHRPVVDLDAAKRAYFAEYGVADTVKRVSVGQRTVIENALDEAGCQLSEIDWFVLPNLGVQRLRNTYFAPFGIAEERTTLTWLTQVGHLGPGDQFGGLAWLGEQGLLRPGQRCMLLGVGAGFTWSAGVVDILEAPSW